MTMPDDKNGAIQLRSLTKTRKVEPTATSSALTGIVATTLLTADEVWKDRRERRIALGAVNLARGFLNMTESLCQQTQWSSMPVEF